MSTNTTGPSTTLSWMEEYSPQDKTGAMTDAYTKLAGTVEALRADRDNIELRDLMQQEAWDVTQAWCRHRALEDAGKSSRDIGSWALGGPEMLWVNCGLLDPALLKEFHEPDVLEMDLARLFRVTGGENEFQVWWFSRYLIDRYRERLGVEEHVRLQEKLEKARAHVTTSRRDMAVSVADSREFLSEHTNGDAELQAKHGKLEVMLPFQAKMTALGKGGGVKDRGTHRVHMKVTEATRTLLQAIDDRLGVYKLKREFAALYSESLSRTITLVQAEADERIAADALDAGGGAHFQAKAEDCLDAIEQSFDDVRSLASRIADTPQFVAPPFVLEHLPRVDARMAAESFDDVLEACPRFKVSVSEAERPPRLLLLPGVGNAIYDKKAREIVATLYPTESRQTSLIGAIGESFLVDDEPTRNSYQRLRGLESNSSKAFSDAFQRDFFQWVTTDWQTRRNLTKEVHKWFHHNFIIRRSSD
ncbi:MAG: hypothetical protein AAF581_01415 [Planctomycetota bacterium]